MSRIIDEHFFNELFQERRVKCYKSIYRSLFNKIWPSSENFINFLKSSSTDLKINYAIKIYENLTLINDIFLPPFTILNVLYQQTNDLQDNNKKYIPQDHVIHSVNLYILGVYIFFNSEKISNKIIFATQSKDFYSVIKKFILKWQLFAFYHDVGYFFENTQSKIDKEIFKKYDDLYDSIVHNLIVKNISKFLTYKMLADKSKNIINVDSINLNSSCWYDLKDKRYEGDTVKQLIKEFDGAVCIEGISNDEEFLPILSLLKDKEYLVVAYNEFGEILSIIVRKKFDILKFYSRSIEFKNNFFINDHLNDTNKNFRFQYYINGINDMFWKNAFDVDVLNTRNIFETLSSRIRNYIAINNEDVENVLYAMNNWINKVLPLEGIKENEVNKKQEIDCYKESLYLVFTNAFLNELRTDEVTIENMADVNWLKNFVSNIIDAELNKKIDSDFQDKFQEQYGRVHSYVQFLQDTMQDILKQDFVAADKKSLTFYDYSDFKISPFAYNHSNKNHKKLYEIIKQLSNELNINFKQLENYEPKYDNTSPILSDHGKASACLLFQAVAFILDMKERYKNKSIALAWDPSSDDDIISLCAESIFAILLHNIYNKKSNSNYGIEYHQDFDKNSFSYFCTFCDNIQSWGRPKQLDYSKTVVPPINYLEDEFDIYIVNDTICIKCKDKYLNHINKKIENDESFLPGIKELIKIEQFIV